MLFSRCKLTALVSLHGWLQVLCSDTTDDQNTNDDKFQVVHAEIDSERARSAVRSIHFDDIEGVDSFRMEKDSTTSGGQERKVTGPCPESFISHANDNGTQEKDVIVTDFSDEKEGDSDDMMGSPPQTFTRKGIKRRETKLEQSSKLDQLENPNLDDSMMLGFDQNDSDDISEISSRRNKNVKRRETKLQQFSKLDQLSNPNSDDSSMVLGFGQDDSDETPSQRLPELAAQPQTDRSNNKKTTIKDVDNDVSIREAETTSPSSKNSKIQPITDEEATRSKNARVIARKKNVKMITRAGTSLQSIFLNPHRYSQKTWLTITALICWLFGLLAFYISYCQLLDAKAIDLEIMLSDVERAKDLIFNPELATHCLDTYQYACARQYRHSVWFVVCGVYLVVQGLLRFGESRKSVHVHPSRCEKTKGPQSAGRKYLSPKIVGWMKWAWAKKESIDMGGKYFWKRSFGSLFMDVFLQCLRCFVVAESYATTRAAQTIAQMVVIALYVDFSMLAFYHQSEISFMATSWLAEISFLVVRHTQEGHLSMRSTSILDFCTLFLPFVWCIAEIQEFNSFIQNATKQTKVAQESLKSSKRTRGIIAISTGLTITIAVIIASIITVDKGFHQDCPASLIGEIQHKKDGFLPAGMQCYSWQFNLYLDPPCSCAYLDMRDEVFDCPMLNQDPEHKFGHCPLIQADFDLIGSWTNLRMLWVDIADRSINGTFTIKPFKNLENLISLYISEATGFQEMDVDVLDSWAKLESIYCDRCFYMQPDELFRPAKVPRLNVLKLYGVQKCADDQFSLSQVENFRCVSLTDKEECPGIPQFDLARYLDKVKSATRTRCYQPRCRDVLRRFIRGHENNGLLGTFEFHTFLTRDEDYNKDAFTCTPHFDIDKSMFEKVRATFSETFTQDLYPNSTPADGLTVHEFAAMDTAYSTCEECPESKQLAEDGAAFFAASQEKSDQLPAECDLFVQNWPLVTRKTFTDPCTTTVNTCKPFCVAIASIFALGNTDNNQYMSEYEMRDSLTAFSAPDGDDVVLHMERAVAIGGHIGNYGLSTCSECE